MERRIQSQVTQVTGAELNRANEGQESVKAIDWRERESERDKTKAN